MSITQVFIAEGPLRRMKNGSTVTGIQERSNCSKVTELKKIIEEFVNQENRGRSMKPIERLINSKIGLSMWW